MANNKKKVVYVLDQSDRIGQLSGEMFYLRNVYPENEYQIFVITTPPAVNHRINTSVYEIVTRGVNVFHTTDKRILNFNAKNLEQPVIEQNNTLYFMNEIKLSRTFISEFKHKKPSYYFSLSAAEIQQGQTLRDNFCIPADATIVTLHVREPGYMHKHTYNSYRDANIENYFPAIDYLIKQGFYIVRLGDKTMKPFENPPKQLIDAPFHSQYCSFVEPYFISQSKFYLGTGSGPLSVARGFGIPTLSINSPVMAGFWGFEQDMFVFKKYFYKQQNRYLNYEEIITSPLINYYASDHFTQSGIEIHQNTKEEILASVIELNTRLDGVYPVEPHLDQKIKDIEKKADHVWQQPDAHQSIISLPYYSLFYYPAFIGQEYIKLNPHFCMN